MNKNDLADAAVILRAHGHHTLAQRILALAEQPAQQQYQSTADKCELTPVPAKGGLLPAQQQEPLFKPLIDLHPGSAEELKAMDAPAQQEPVERGGLRFYTNGTERQHWKADGSIDFKDKQGNVTMTIAAGSITSPQPSKPLTDEEIWKFWWSRPEVPDGEDDSMEAEFVAAVRRILAANGIKENT